MSRRRTPQARGADGRFLTSWRVRGVTVRHCDPAVPALDERTPDDRVLFTTEAAFWVWDVALALFGLLMLAGLVWLLVIWAPGA